ncbi:MAG: protein kinase domain-containing protein [Polyangiaceae bacterium]
MGGSLEPGTVFAERYIIEAQLGGGSAGVVFSALHADLKQRVAIKWLRDSAPIGVERMVREARAALALHSEHIVRVMDVGSDPDGHAYIVMEQLDGADLGSILQQRGFFEIEEAVDYVLQACAGIAEAHARGIVHRDLKPSNLFLTTRADGAPLVKVLDFGISKTAADEDDETSLTGPAEMVGSPRYMSPEQVRGQRNVDHRTDIWALGVILFRFISGKAPFGGQGKGISGALASVVVDAPPSLRGFVPEVPAELEAVIMRCLAKSPDERHASAAELAARLAPFGSSDGRAAAARLVHSIAGMLSSETDTSPPPPMPKAKPDRRLVLLGAIAAMLAVPAVALGVLAHGQHPAAPAQATSVGPTVRAVSTASATAFDAALATIEVVSASAAPTTSPASTPAPHAVIPRALAPARPRPAAANSNVVKSAATDDRY